MKLLIILAMLVSPAYGHSFYSLLCCNEKDCRPVDRGVVVFGFQKGVSGYYIKDRLPGILEFFPEIENGEPNTRIHHSQDFQNHICRPLTGGIMGKRINTQCIYVAPPGN